MPTTSAAMPAAIAVNGFSAIAKLTAVMAIAMPPMAAAIAKNARYSYHYSLDIIKTPFPRGEAAIAKSAEFSFAYARDVLKAPFALGEAAISKCPLTLKRYVALFPKRAEKVVNANLGDFKAWLVPTA